MAVYVDTGRAHREYGIEFYLSVQPGEFDTWVIDCPDSVIPADCLLGYWDHRRGAIRGINEASELAPEDLGG